MPGHSTKISDYIGNSTRMGRINAPTSHNSDPDEPDATREIRNLVQDLQSSAKEAREKLKVAETEKHALARELEIARAKIEQLAERDRSLREQYVDVKSLMRERDSAKEVAENLAMNATNSQQQLENLIRERDAIRRQRDEALKQKDDLMKQRDELLRQREENARRSDDISQTAREATVQLSQVQRQLVSIRQARDAAAAQAREMMDKLAKAEDEVAELGYAREIAQKSVWKFEEEASALKRQLESVLNDRTNLQRQLEEVSREVDGHRKRILDLAQEKAAVAQEGSEQAAAISEMRKQVTDLTEERDGERRRVQEHSKVIDDLQKQLTSLREQQAAYAIATAELDDARRQLAGVTEDHASATTRERELLKENEAQQERLVALADEIAKAQLAREEALGSVSSAQRQIDELLRERDALRLESESAVGRVERELESLRRELESVTRQSENAARLAAERERALASANEQQRDLKQRADNYERQRLEAIDLAAALDATKREILELSATLAEARLQARVAMTRAARFIPSGSPKMEIKVNPEMAEGSPQPATSSNSPLNESDAKNAVSCLRRLWTDFTRAPAEIELLHEMHCQSGAFSTRSRISEMMALHRLTGAFSSLLLDLFKAPELINPSILRTVSLTIDFLGVLIKDGNLIRLKDPATAKAFVIEDDLENSQAIALALETVMVGGKAVQTPREALAELTHTSYDIIFIDVNLPVMDGFQLCEAIRKMELHARTPIIFITGLTTVENRVQSTLSGGNDFIGKPFNIQELAVKSLTYILRASMGIE